MFGHLVIKEWKERWTLAVFGIGGVLAGFAIAAWAWPRVREAPAYLLGAMYLIFFPVFGALLGATGFEAEFRNGAWAYLLSRPVKRTTIWLAKFLALLSILVFVGLLSFGLVFASAKLKAAASTLTAPGLGGGNDPLISMLVVGFGLSLLTFALAFAMSLLTERTITVTAVSLFLGFAVYGGWLYGFAAVSELLVSRFQPSLIWVGLVLTGLVALVASFETFRKADFSQPRRKAGFFWRRAGLLFVPVLVSIVLVAVWPPGRGRWLFGYADEGRAFFNTYKGYYVYSADTDQTKKLRLPVVGRYILLASARAGRLAGYEATRRSESIFIARADGSEKVFLTGPTAKDPRLRDQELRVPGGPLISPDGRAAVFCTWPRRRSSIEKNPNELWLVSDQGDVLKHADVILPEFAAEDYFHSYIYLAAWPENGNLVLFNLHGSSRIRERPNYIMAWDIDRNELRVLVRDASLASRTSLEDRFPVRRRSADGTGWTLSLFDLKTATLSDVWTETNLVTQLASVRYEGAWNPDARNMAFLADRDNPPRCVLGIYGWPEQKIICQRDLSRKDIRNTELAWTPDGSELVVRNSSRKGLEFFNKNLEPTRFVAFPEGEIFLRLMVVGDKLIVQDWSAYRVWRLDLKTEEWRRIF